MPRSISLRPLAIVLAAALCGAMASPALADATVTVTFQPNSHWAQEVNTIGHYDSSRDYSVAIEANKTLQINLVTRDPNVFFKVKDETHRKQLVDTYQTGATTWSTTTTEPTTYSIHVYVIPEAMQQGENPKYALQIGQYGQSDMQPETTTVAFDGHNPWVQEAGTLDAQGSAHDYAVAIAAGQTLGVNLVTHNPEVHFKVSDQAKNQTLVDSASSHGATWSTPVAAATNYTISVYADPAALPPGSRAGYVLQVGQYVQGTTQPAAAGSAALPPTAPASTAGTPAATSSTD